MTPEILEPQPPCEKHDFANAVIATPGKMFDAIQFEICLNCARIRVDWERLMVVSA